MENRDLENALTATENLLRQIIVLKLAEHYWALTLWIAYCYSIPEFDFAPRLCFWSPEKRCGKSLALEVVAHLLPNPLRTSSISSAGLFRLLHADKTKVLLIDESDTVFGRNGDKEKAEALRTLLNASFKTGQVVIRCEAPKYEPKEFQIFAPIALAGIGKNAIPETVADRALMIEMRRMLPDERILEKPLYKVAECAGGEWIKKALLASVALSSGESDPEEASLSLRLLHDTREIFTEDQITTKDLIERLRELEESPWSYLERFNPSVLAHLLKNYGIKPKPFSGGKVRGYYRKSFEDPWSRYLDPVQTVTPVTPVTPDELDLEAS